uniref:DNA-directed RNA polymerases I, II, and III subunit RPABC3 n=1 Tax=Rhizochromulina marina TaxID=1034831 RepID=A0A7S2R5B9_9STRA|mmetsp:Transcript_10366/g.29615  ORF Transcript_10366/g.29615 Transcript_10366/m.29615 type:complete len:146 (+) Transcript_10366:92-529(+)|eukprot:CAMPEP_0118963552 /NCGR_PEP_ID=MMETSP1173-20130426/1397_1 /TAXON_ID=1034831 /ORGANISM="Rhizochromulina marina cf, Strain CCMP1243" /LENGTH=145 /DNA_ID=CAMNT_0006911891 /DNA_START=69 /DNA_END=506 /DNA_ORIENTATION=+
MSRGILFTETFEVVTVNPEGKVFDRINRLMAKAETYNMELLVDVNCELWQVNEHDKISFALASSLAIDGTADDGTYNQDDGPSLLDQYEYAMHGRVYGFNHKKDDVIEIDVSFGGLLLRLTGDARHLTSIELDQNIYCLMNKLQG